ncbi:hypothetical protein BRYFOR_06906 [Marvinbryantia formatexigens DSM 14469]|uniref:Uncharacterized protein n=1 Tax=Marvinbryantia formatexigens DSM 14469 TaxID=478749 RepID=C6LE57_9FIRM|nr:hypothetical protein BRYFOR_06906 [Marvinbryantia formatexigens DSM 14469]
MPVSFFCCHAYDKNVRRTFFSCHAYERRCQWQILQVRIRELHRVFSGIRLSYVLPQTRCFS